jgi:hypothetical protein
LDPTNYNGRSGSFAYQNANITKNINGKSINSASEYRIPELGNIFFISSLDYKITFVN